MTNLKRREFLEASSMLGLGAGIGALRAVTPARAEELVVGVEPVRFRAEIEPVVRWIEETPRERIFDAALAQLKDGLSYRDLLAGLFLAGIRNIQPRPVGFKFHAVMAINSAHVLGQSAPVDDRLLPMFWALDNFKSAQAADVKEGDWSLARVDERRLPGPERAERELVAALDAWDEEAADVAMAAFHRTAGAARVMEVLWRYGLRDQRNIGHKPIFTMQCWRTLQTIGWGHGEPVLRSLVFGILDRQGDSQKAPVGVYPGNLEKAQAIRTDWTCGRHDAVATRSLLESLREVEPDSAAAAVVEYLNSGVSAAAVWDAVILAGNELLLQSPGIIPLHAVTSANALHYIFAASGDDTNRKLALLQAASWIPLFRDRARTDRPLELDAFEPVETGTAGPEAVAEIFTTAAHNRRKAAAQVVSYLQSGGSPGEFFATARRMIFHKGADSHQYKYGAAVWEEFLQCSKPEWQAAIAAAAMAYLPSSETSDSPLMRRAREAADRVLGRASA